MSIPLKKALFLAWTAAGLIAAHSVQAQGKVAVSYPGKPVRLVVASAAGGGTDINARMLAGGLTAAWSQQVVVDNRSGAGGTIATDIVAKSQPDGHTLLFQSLGISYAPALYKNLPFDVQRDIADVMGNVGRCDVTNNIYGAKWTKLIANTMTMGPFGLLGLRNFEAAALPGMFDISVKLGRESFAVGAALGYRINSGEIKMGPSNYTLLRSRLGLK